MANLNLKQQQLVALQQQYTKQLELGNIQAANQILSNVRQVKQELREES